MNPSRRGGELELDELRLPLEDDLACLLRGMPLADLECRHGGLPHDRALECGCFR